MNFHATNANKEILIINPIIITARNALLASTRTTATAMIFVKNV